jgi:pyruvate/2-oxoglutarate dehydrogenase complex dihydrolipoamide dehydrogenase (E3) component
MAFDYDMIVIGGGAAGLTASGMSALLGAKTALIEEHRLGGDCTWNGCVPSKTLLHAARVAHTIRSGTAGVTAAPPTVDFGSAMSHVRKVRQNVYEDADAPRHFERMAVKVIAAKARFVDDHTLELSSPDETRRITSRFFVIATGSRPKNPGFPVPTLDNESLFELTAQPARLVILGGGPVGIEMSQAFSRLGSKVSVVHAGQEILPRDDRELAGTLRQLLTEEGIAFNLGRRVTAVTRASSGLVAQLDNGAEIPCDALLAAIGREPNIESLALDQAGVSTGPGGISVDNRCRTSRSHIYASGDVTGRYQFTHMAEHMSKVAVTNAILRFPKKLDEKGITWCTFTSPELAQVGRTEESLRATGEKYSKWCFPFSKLDRAITEGETTGMVKVLSGPSKRVLGASILGVCAGEVIAGFALAMRGGLPLARIASTILPYPTYALGNRRAVDQMAIQQLDSPMLGWLGRVLGYRGERRGSAAL